MPVILKHTFHTLFRKPIQSLISVISSFIVTAILVLVCCMPEVLRVNASGWAARDFGEADVVMGFHETFDNFDDPSYFEKGKEDSAISDYLLCYERSTKDLVYLENSTVMCDFSVTQDMEHLIDFHGLVLLEGTADLKANISDGYTNCLVNARAKDKYGLEVGDSLTLLGENYKIAGILDNLGYANSHYSFKIFIEGTKVNKAQVKIADQAKFDAFLNSKPSYILHAASSTLLRDVERSVNNAMMILWIVAVLVTCIMVYLLAAAFNVIVKNRTDSLLLFKSAGATPFQCVGILMMEAFFYILVGGGLGLAGGFGLVQIVQNILRNTIRTITVTIPYWVYLLAMGVVILAGFLVLVPTIYFFVRKPIHTMMGRGPTKRRIAPLWLSILSFIAMLASTVYLMIAKSDQLILAILLFMALVSLFFIISMPYIMRGVSFLLKPFIGRKSGKLARASIKNGRSPSTITTSLVLIQAFLWAVSCLITVVYDTGVPSYTFYRGDYILTVNPNNYQEALDYIENYDGVEDAAFFQIGSEVKLKKGEINYGSRGTDLVGVESSKDLVFFIPNFDIDSDIAKAFDEMDAPLIPSYQEAGLLKGATVGDKVTVNEVETEIIYVNEVFNNHTNQCITKLDVVQKVCGQWASNQIIIKGELGEFSRAREDFAPYGVLFNTSDYFATSTSSDTDFNQALSLLNIVIYVIAGMAVFNLIVSASLERKREFANYQLTGATKGDLFKMIIIEAIVIAFTGIVGGYLVSEFVSYIGPAFALVIDRYRPVVFTSLTMILIVVISCGITLIAQIASNIIVCKNAKKNETLARLSDFRN